MQNSSFNLFFKPSLNCTIFLILKLFNSGGNIYIMSRTAITLSRFCDAPGGAVVGCEPESEMTSEIL